MTTENLPEVQAKARGLRDYLENDQIKGQLKIALPKWLSIDRFLRVVFGALVDNPALLDVTKESLLRSIMQCAQLGLEPIKGLGRAYLIPYKNNRQINGQWQKVPECQFQIGYQGLVDLVRRSGQIIDIEAKVVYENDGFEIVRGTGKKMIYKQHLGADPGAPIGVYTWWQFKDGHEGFDFMPMHEINKRRDRSQAWQRAQKYPNDKNAQKTPWVEWPEEMARKTALKNHLKMLPMTIEFMEAVKIDDDAEYGKPELVGAPVTGFGSPAITLPEAPALTMPEPAEFDTEYADIIYVGKSKKVDPVFTAFFELARESNAVDGKPPTDDELKVLALTDKRGRQAFRDAFNDFAKAQKKTKPKKATKGKGDAKKSGTGGKGAAKTAKNDKGAGDEDGAGTDDEYKALQQADEWQEMGLIFDSFPALYQKYNGKDVRTFDGAKEFLDAVNADPDYKDQIPGA